MHIPVKRNTPPMATTNILTIYNSFAINGHQDKQHYAIEMDIVSSTHPSVTL